MRKCHHFYLWWCQITGHGIISCAVGTISFSPEAVRQVSVGRFRHASLLTGVGHVSVIRFRHASLLTSVRQVSAGTCFTAHSSGAGVIHEIQTWFTAHISAACISWHKLHCSQQCCRCRSADLGTLRCWLKTLLQMAPHSSSLFGFELLGCDDLFGGNLEEHLFCSVFCTRKETFQFQEQNCMCVAFAHAQCVQILILTSSHTEKNNLTLIVVVFCFETKSIFLAAQHISMNFRQTWKYLKAVTAGMSASLPPPPPPPHVSVVPLGNCSHEQHTNKWKMKGRNAKRPLRKRAKTNNIQWKESEAISTCSLQSSNGYLIKSRDLSF